MYYNENKFEAWSFIVLDHSDTTSAKAKKINICKKNELQRYTR